MKNNMSRHSKVRFKVVATILLVSALVVTTFILSSEFLIPFTKVGSVESSSDLALSNISKKVDAVAGDSIKIGISHSMPKVPSKELKQYFREMSSSHDLMFFEVFKSDLSSGINYKGETSRLASELSKDINYIKSSFSQGRKLLLVVYDDSLLDVSLSDGKKPFSGSALTYKVCGKNKCTNITYLGDSALLSGKVKPSIATSSDSFIVGHFGSPALSEELRLFVEKGYSPLFVSDSSSYQLGSSGSDERTSNTLKKFTRWKEGLERKEHQGGPTHGFYSKDPDFKPFNKTKGLWSSSMTKNILAPACRDHLESACLDDVVGSEVFRVGYKFSGRFKGNAHFPITMSIKL